MLEWTSCWVTSGGAPMRSSVAFQLGYMSFHLKTLIVALLTYILGYVLKQTLKGKNWKVSTSAPPTPQPKALNRWAPKGFNLDRNVHKAYLNSKWTTQMEKEAVQTMIIMNCLDLPDKYLEEEVYVQRRGLTRRGVRHPTEMWESYDCSLLLDVGREIKPNRAADQ